MAFVAGADAGAGAGAGAGEISSVPDPSLATFKSSAKSGFLGPRPPRRCIAGLTGGYREQLWCQGRAAHPGAPNHHAAGHAVLGHLHVCQM